nr:hypothetical protein [Micromonospora tarapacensis]
MFRRRAGVLRPVVGPGAVGAVGVSRVGKPVPARPVVRLFVPGPADVGAVGPGRREWRHLRPPDGARPTPRRWGLVVDADVARVALARELRLPLRGRLGDPGRFGGIVPPVGVAATHPPDLSLRPGDRR